MLIIPLCFPTDEKIKYASPFYRESTVENDYLYQIQTLTDKIFKDECYLKLRYSPFKTPYEKMSLTNQNYIDCY